MWVPRAPPLQLLLPPPSLFLLFCLFGSCAGPIQLSPLLLIRDGTFQYRLRVRSCADKCPQKREDHKVVESDLSIGIYGFLRTRSSYGDFLHRTSPPWKTTV